MDDPDFAKHPPTSNTMPAAAKALIALTFAVLALLILDSTVTRAGRALSELARPPQPARGIPHEAPASPTARASPPTRLIHCFRCGATFQTRPTRCPRCQAPYHKTLRSRHQ